MLMRAREIYTSHEHFHTLATATYLLRRCKGRHNITPFELRFRDYFTERKFITVII